MTHNKKPGLNNNHLREHQAESRPDTSIVENPNPRANENISDPEEQVVSDDNDPSRTGSEITDGEDG